MKHGIKRQVKSLMAADRHSPLARQHGVALLFLVVAIALAFSAYYFSKVSIVEIQADNVQKTRLVLKTAKNALIAYATIRSDLTDPSVQPAKYGYLPCPDFNGDGNSVGNCGVAGTSTIGWFPWRSLGMETLRDSNGDCLLYAVSSTYKYKPEAGMLNDDTNFGMFQVVDEYDNIIYGETAQNRIVGIVFSAGTALTGQVRDKDPNTECGDLNGVAAYLDELEVPPGSGKIVNNSDVETATNRIDTFIQAISTDSQDVFNDQLIVITRDEIWPKAISHRVAAFDISDTTGTSKVRRLTEALARCLASYANDNDNSSLPFPAALDVVGNDYRDNDSYSDSVLSYVGRYPFKTDVSDGVLAAPDASSLHPIDNSVGGAVLFDKVFNGPIEPAQPPIVPLSSYIWQCSELLIDSPSGSYADLKTSSEDRRLWDNWKDHIIYAVSERYAARAIPNDDVIQPRCNDVLVSNNKCITFNGTEYAAIVIYAGERLKDVVIDPGPPEVTLTQTREAPVAPEDSDGLPDPDDVIDTKLDIDNYIEVVGPINSGSGDGIFSPETYSNDLFFCLTDTEPIDVIECI